MESEYFLKNRLTENENRLKFVRQELESCCKGRLSEERKSGHVHFVQNLKVEGKRVRKGINGKPELIESLIRRRIFEKEEAFLVREQKTILQLYDDLSAFDLAGEIERLERDCPHLGKERILNALYLNASADWQQASYEQSDYKPENKKQITSRGLRVRSKSELLIAEKLYAYNIAFRYEEVLHFGDATLVPDFTIRKADGKIILWEHMGLMTNDAYRTHQKRKVELYESFGYVPWDNLIITYDTPDGLLDLRIIESEIQNKL